MNSTWTCAINHGSDQAWALPVWQLLTPCVYTKRTRSRCSGAHRRLTLSLHERPRSTATHTHAVFVPQLPLRAFTPQTVEKKEKSFSSFTTFYRPLMRDIRVQMAESVILWVLMSFSYNHTPAIRIPGCVRNLLNMFLFSCLYIYKVGGKNLWLSSHSLANRAASLAKNNKQQFDHNLHVQCPAHFLGPLIKICKKQ